MSSEIIYKYQNEHITECRLAILNNFLQNLVRQYINICYQWVVLIVNEWKIVVVFILSIWWVHSTHQLQSPIIKWKLITGQLQDSAPLQTVRAVCTSSSSVQYPSVSSHSLPPSLWSLPPRSPSLSPGSGSPHPSSPCSCWRSSCFSMFFFSASDEWPDPSKRDF